ncbi:Chloramphenicol acetyltransferase 3 [Pseudoalteromonas holothuriae]|uniref:Chloramphenicol acetyltransferase 3 n=1 Tax=Pseudoalteromonas holothuriae TaxID=2963714 RepID=A0A9W4VN10_9GAMM|nr:MULTISPECIES: CatA-like O-acetyltransferase [unclassified Pseudoalteromonas]CAH9051297.1 Chloramphenicol acetyltransferase 3 [Pseudoalteromonas sp. CIP111854]CAH9056786.1 Chloramphenicol acetyltransferase 3 [Pseudoalteromonas sp. CIP111951]
MKKIDLDTWPRAQHFHFFKGFDKPHFNITTHVDFSALYQFARTNGYSFTQSYLYCLLKAVNQCTSMRYRIVDDQPVEVDELMASTVFLKGDETFRFTPLYLKKNLGEFCEHVHEQKSYYMNQALLTQEFELRETQVSQIHVSVLPWFNFTSFSHAAHETSHCSGVPKFVFGQYQHNTGLMPLNIEVHHALMDGVHVAQFLTTLKQVIFELVD